MTEQAIRVAAIDCGTNCIRLLVADVIRDRDGAPQLVDVHREMRVVRLGEGVDATGRLSQHALDRTWRALADYVAVIRASGAVRTRMVATSATRDAANRGDFTEMVNSTLGQDPEVISGGEEAELSFAGAVGELDPATGPFLVVDIGGGSTELVIGTRQQGRSDILGSVSLNIGCVRMSERHLHSDPPTAEEVAGLRREAAEMLPGDVPAGSLIGVAGTITTLATIDLGLDEEIPERVDGHELSTNAVAAQLERLAALPLEERRQVRGLMPERASTIVAGTAILAELMGHLGAERLTVSERDILHGAALEAADQPA